VISTILSYFYALIYLFLYIRVFSVLFVGKVIRKRLGAKVYYVNVWHAKKSLKERWEIWCCRGYFTAPKIHTMDIYNQFEDIW